MSKEIWNSNTYIKVDLLQRLTDKEGHYIIVKGTVQQEDITTVNIYAPNMGAPQYIR